MICQISGSDSSLLTRIHVRSYKKAMKDTGDTPRAEWRPFYEAAMLELDSAKMLELIAFARRAIHNRLEHSLNDEQRKMQDALTALQNLQRIAQHRKEHPLED